MAYALSDDLRRRLVVADEMGRPCRPSARRFGVSSLTSFEKVNQWFQEGHIEPVRQVGDNRSARIESHLDEVLALIDATPDIAMTKLAEYLEEVHGMGVSKVRSGGFLIFKKNVARKRAIGF
ncbi:hypothetical protein [uncultured Roseibium sp.]|uniref:hypothetical protein n=1 Tax=uncultured Roseibium sp. TaxID=1936171 RepID=UPI002606C275|nr:hypothetical protein [uncultured Roseibium sp.]